MNSYSAVCQNSILIGGRNGFSECSVEPVTDQKSVISHLTITESSPADQILNRTYGLGS